MQYISAEEFLKQDEKIRKNLIDWWQPEFGDLFVEDSEINVVGCVPINKEHFEDYNGKIHYKTDLTIPLLTEGQLRKFIENRTQGNILLNYSLEDNKYNKNQISIVSEYRLTNFKNLDENLLQAYWQVACNIANY